MGKKQIRKREEKKWKHEKESKNISHLPSTYISWNWLNVSFFYFVRNVIFHYWPIVFHQRTTEIQRKWLQRKPFSALIRKYSRTCSTIFLHKCTFLVITSIIPTDPGPVIFFSRIFYCTKILMQLFFQTKRNHTHTSSMSQWGEHNSSNRILFLMVVHSAVWWFSNIIKENPPKTKASPPPIL